MRRDVTRRSQGQLTSTSRSGRHEASPPGHDPVLKRCLSPFSQTLASARPVFIMQHQGAVSTIFSPKCYAALSVGRSPFQACRRDQRPPHQEPRRPRPRQLEGRSNLHPKPPRLMPAASIRANLPRCRRDGYYFRAGFCKGEQNDGRGKQKKFDGASPHLRDPQEENRGWRRGATPLRVKSAVAPPRRG